MEIREKLKEIQYAPWHRLKMNYEQLKNAGSTPALPLSSQKERIFISLHRISAFPL